jgi:hypothetical protein
MLFFLVFLKSYFSDMQLHTHYKNELYFPSLIKLGDKNNYVKKLQEFLILSNTILKFEQTIKLTPDSDFKGKTLLYLKLFQKTVGLPITGIADTNTIEKLTNNFKNAFTTIPNDLNFRFTLLFIAKNHLKNGSCELYTHWKINNNYNKGPWVRSYCDGDDYLGKEMGPKWCAGFVKTILDLACLHQNFNYTKFISNTLSCDIIAQNAKDKQLLKRFDSTINFYNNINVGDIFLTYSTNPEDLYLHTGFVSKVYSNGNFETIEGNSSYDSEKTHAGYKVISKTRNFKDVFYFDENNNFTTDLLLSKYKQFYYFYTLDI